MPKMKLQNTATVRLGGKNPGQVFFVEQAEDGLPADRFWRNRMDDDQRFGLSTVRIITAAVVTPATAPEPPPPPVSVSESPVTIQADPAPAAEPKSKKGKA